MALRLVSDAPVSRLRLVQDVDEPPTMRANASGSAGAVNKKAEAIWGGSFDDWKRRKEADDAERARMVAESEAGNVGSRRAQEFQRKVAALNREGDQTGDYSADSLRPGRALESGMEQGREQIGAGLQFAGETPLALADFFGRIRPKGETEQDRSNPVTEAGKDIRGAAVARQQEIAPLMIDRPDSLLSMQGAKYIAQSALQSAPTTGTGLAATVINPAAGLSLMGAGAGSAKFADARAEDKGYWLSAEAGAAAAAAEVVPEMLPLGFLSGRLLKHLPGTAMKRMASSPAGRGALLALSEGASEGVTELSNIAYEIAREGKSYSDDQIEKRLIDATAVGTVMGGGMAAVAEATGQSARAYDQSKIADLELENSLRAAIKPRATTARILTPNASPDAVAGAQVADDAFRAAGVGTVAAADMAEQDALSRDLDAAQRDQLSSEAEIDRLLTGGINGEAQRPVQAQAQPGNGRVVPDGQDAGRAGAAIPGFSGGLPAGVRASYPGDSAESGSSVGFVGDGGIGSRNAPAPQQFTELANGTIFVPGDPVQLRQRAADAGFDVRGLAETRNGVTGVRFGTGARDQIIGLFGGADPASSVEQSQPSAPPEAAGVIAPPALDAKRTYGDTVFDERAHDLLDFIALNGGLDRTALESEGIDPANWNSRAAKGKNDRFFGKPLFRKSGGMSLETLREKARDAGFRTDKDVLDLIGDSLGGRKTFTPAGSEYQTALADVARQEADAQARQQRVNALPPSVPETDADAYIASRETELDAPADRDGTDIADIESTLASVADTSPQQRASVVSLGHDYTAKLIELKRARAAGALNPDQQEAYIDLLEQDRETGKVAGRPMVGIGNKTAYVDALMQGKLMPVQVFLDADNFKALNDKFGHDVGDDAIRLIADVVRAEFGDGNVFHRGGDEFLTQGMTQEEVDAKMARVQSVLANYAVDLPLSDGRTATLPGIGVSYGTGANEKAADDSLKQDKQRRKEAGLRFDRREGDGVGRVGSGADGARTDASGTDANPQDRTGPAAEGVGDVQPYARTESAVRAADPVAQGGSEPVRVRDNQRGSGEGSARDGVSAATRTSVATAPSNWLTGGRNVEAPRAAQQAGDNLTVDKFNAELTKAYDKRFAQRLARIAGIYATWRDVPKADRDAIAADGVDIRTVAGVVLNGKIILIPGNMKRGEGVGVTIHEVGVHFGMAGLPGFAELLRDFKAMRSRIPAVDRAFKSVPGDTPKNLIDEEAFAYFVEQNWNVKSPLMTRIKDAIARLLNRLGIPTSGITDALMRQALDGMIAKAREAADGATRGVVTVRDGKIVYARDLLGEAPSETAQLVAQWKAKVDAKLRGDGRAYVKPSEGPGDLFGGPAEETSDLFAKPQQRAQGTLFSRKRDNSTAAEDRALDRGNLEEAIRIGKRRIAEQREALGDISNGVILKMDGRDSWAIVMPDVEGGGKWRMQMFDRRGFVGHRTRNSRDAALDEALQDKYTTRDDGALDEIQDSPEFVRGNFIAGEMMQLNAGKITSAEFDKRIADYDSSVKVVAKYSFAGRNAKTANIGTLEQAQAMIAERYDPEVVRQKTGWHQGADEKWRFEIDDSGAKFIATRVPPERLREINQKSWNHGNKDGWMTEREFLREYPTKPEAKAILLRMNMETDRINWNTPTLGDVLDHPELYAAYPGIRGIRVAINNKLAIGRGAYAAADNAIVLSPMNDKDTLSVLLHEIQHGIQEIEGFAKGGSPLDARNVSAIDLMREENARFQKMQEEKEASPEYKAFVRDFIANLPESERSIKSRRGDSMIDVSERLAESAAREKFIAPIEDARRAALDAISKEDKNGGDIGGMIGYRRLAGEVEARNVQARQNLMGDETRRAISPQSTQDVPDERQVVRYSRKADGGSVEGMKRTIPDDFERMPEFQDGPDSTVLFHGSRVDGYLDEVKDRSNEAFSQWPGLFASGSAMAARSHGKDITAFRIADDKMLKDFDSLNQDEVRDSLLQLLPSRVRSKVESDEDAMDVLWRAVVDDRSDRVLDEWAELTGYEPGEASWHAQSLRGQLGAKLGYKAIEMDDEHGKSWYIVPGVKSIPLPDESSDTRQAPPREGLGTSGPKYSRRTITINGIERPTTDSTGKRIHPTDEGIRNFWGWFGDSKVVDAERRPLVVYHGTGADIEAFESSGARIKRGKLGRGIYLTPSGGKANLFAKLRAIDGPSNVIPLFASLTNPFTVYGEMNKPATGIDRSALQAAGYDGVVLTNDAGTEMVEVVAFEPTQVKSAIGNNGVFSQSDKRIAYSRRAPTADTIEVDGKQRPTTDSTGKAIHPTEEGVRAFYEWFGDSAVVDDEGRPRVVYHGTNAKFTEFDPWKKRDGWLGKGFYFTEDAEQAARYGSNVMPVYLAGDRVINTLTEKISGSGKRPVTIGQAAVGRGTVYVVDKPTQIKSADQSTGTFSPTDPRIAYSRKTPTEARAESAQKQADLGAQLVVSPGQSFVYTDQFTDDWRGQTRKMRERIQDKLLSVRDAQKDIEQIRGAIEDAANVYRRENLMHGRVGDQRDKLQDTHVKPLIEAMAEAKVSPALLEDYLEARHAKERNEKIAATKGGMPDGASGMTTAQAEDFLQGRAAGHRSGVTLDPAMTRQVSRLARKVYAVTAETRRRLLDSGQITQEAFDALENAYAAYVPLRGKDGTEGGKARGTGKGIDVRGKPVLRAAGRGEGNRAQNILAEVIADAERSIINAEKLRVGRTLARLVLENPNPDVWAIEPVKTELKVSEGTPEEIYEAVKNLDQEEGTIIVKVKGKPYRIVIEDQRMADALKNMAVETVPEVIQYVAGLNRYFSAVLTRYNPSFVGVNMTRDLLFGMTGIWAEHGAAAAAKAAASYFPAMRAAWRDIQGKPPVNAMGRYAREFAEAGGKTYFGKLENVSDMSQRIGEEFKTFRQMAMPKFLGGEMSPVRALAKVARDSKMVQAIEAVNDTVENTLRLSVYAARREAGASIEQAAEYAKNISVNFNRRGSATSWLNALYLFFNAATQGAHRTLTLLKNPKVQGVLGGLAALQATSAMFLMGLDDDDGEPLWDSISPWDKQRNLILAIPIKRENGWGATVIKIPMPYGFNLFPYMGGRSVELARDLQEKPVGRAIADYTTDAVVGVAQAMSPIPFDDGWKAALPHWVRIFTVLAENKDDLGIPVRAGDQYDSFDKPRSASGRDDTPLPFKVAATALNRLGGGDDYTPPYAKFALDWAPEDLAYLFKTFAGGLGSNVVKSGTLTEKLIAGVPVNFKDVPVLSSFVSNVDQRQATSTRYYDHKDDIEREVARQRDLAKETGEVGDNPMGIKIARNKSGAKVKRGEGYELEGASGSLFDTYKESEKEISRIRDEMRAAFNDQSISYTERIRKIDELKSEREEVQRELNAAWREQRKKRTQ